jgi:hypothetical protein
MHASPRLILSYVMAVPRLDPGISPGHPIRKCAALHIIEITGTGPVVTPGRR